MSTSDVSGLDTVSGYAKMKVLEKSQLQKVILFVIIIIGAGTGFSLTRLAFCFQLLYFRLMNKQKISAILKRKL